ncbi:MAG: bifunctional 23S rRNA (guanine(2069)-N(7))-methyltransferase RlmK/23S rRNA (guanine(2445)-N(2))-methyltransferase RlmL [Spirochaetes bacterium]|nr:bifunctional 23S rRNA (guanine(2069)-N(7))-methyltransferase RlmK/23S rRNA (guanine(2445)-N(2))-methyltransferase RlmL [Spirochaetota bacterium]
MTEKNIQYFATCPRYLEPQLQEELQSLGGTEVSVESSGVRFSGPLIIGYRAYLWSRIASRVLLLLKSFTADNNEELYQTLYNIPWDQHFSSRQTFAIDAETKNTFIQHSHFAALKAKDAIADFFRDHFGKRPSVEKNQPDIRLRLFLKKNQAEIYLDFSGSSLHRRNYRLKRTLAPLRENSAAALLLKAGWRNIAEQGGSFIDPMCGSGTLAIEAAMIAASIAPGLLRDHNGFQHWKQHQPKLWQEQLALAKKQKAQGLQNLPLMIASDIDQKAINNCKENIKTAGLEKYIQVVKSNFQQLSLDLFPQIKEKPGLIATNPPYGERLAKDQNLNELYNHFGQWCKLHFAHYTLAVLAGNKEQAKYIGLRAKKVNAFYNGKILCVLALFELNIENQFQQKTFNWQNLEVGQDDTQGIQMVINRIKKNRKQLKKYLGKNAISCYRVYDADIPQHAAAIDIYDHQYAVIAEYKPPSTIDENKAAKRFAEIVAAVSKEFELDEQHIFIKQRKQQKGKEQYQKVSNNEQFYVIKENNLLFQVNFTDYLDTGIFLDHRITRKKISELAKGKTFLNLFAYTCTASVYAAHGGAVKTVSVDSSKKYLIWGQKNFELNHFSLNQHHFRQKDYQLFLKNNQEKFDLIFIDPPTFSNKKDIQRIFDIQKDHSQLLQLASHSLTSNGLIVFSTNFKKFKLDSQLETIFQIENITEQTLPPDFARSKIHQCWVLSLK